MSRRRRTRRGRRRRSAYLPIETKVGLTAALLTRPNLLDSPGILATVVNGDSSPNAAFRGRRMSSMLGSSPLHSAGENERDLLN
jgi:hypothetical protein